MSALTEHLLGCLAAATSVRPLIITPDRTISYGDARSAISALASRLLGHGAEPGDRLLICTSDDCISTLSYLAALLTGCTAVVVDPLATPEELAGYVAATAPSFFVVAPDLLSSVARSVGVKDVIAATRDKRLSIKDRLLGRKAVASGTDAPSFDAITKPPGTGTIWPAVDDAAIAHILFTSGTTTGPKGVRISHRNLAVHMQTLVAQYGYDPSTRIMNAMPLHHTDGLTQGALLALHAGGSVYRPQPFTIAAIEPWLDAIYRDRITHFYTTPTVLALLLRVAYDDRDAFRTDDFRYVISSAGFLHEKVWREFEDVFRVKVVNVYGLTETVSGSLYCGPDASSRRIGTLGKPVDCAICIVDDSGAEVAKGEDGELWLQGDHVTPGYLAPDQTAIAFSGPWFKTGDLVRLDEDDFVILCGRKKNVIIRGGATISPEEISRVVRTLRGVADAETVGVEDETWGERVVCCVIRTESAPIDAGAVAEHCRSHLAPEKVPTDVVFLESFPRGPAGKVLVPQLRARAQVELAQQRGGTTAGDVEARVLEQASSSFRQSREALSLRSRPMNTRGWDSLGHMDLVVSLESAFGIRLTPKDIMTMGSLKDAADIVRRHLKAEARD